MGALEIPRLRWAMGCLIFLAIGLGCHDVRGLCTGSAFTVSDHGAKLTLGDGTKCRAGRDDAGKPVWILVDKPAQNQGFQILPAGTVDPVPVGFTPLYEGRDADGTLSGYGPLMATDDWHWLFRCVEHTPTWCRVRASAPAQRFIHSAWDANREYAEITIYRDDPDFYHREADLRVYRDGCVFREGYDQGLECIWILEAF